MKVPFHTQSNGSLDIGLRRSFFLEKAGRYTARHRSTSYTQRDYIDFYGS